MKIALSAIALAAASLVCAAHAAEAPMPPKAEPNMQKVLDALASLGGKPIETLTPEEARKQPTPADAVKKVMTDMGKSTAPEPGVTMKEMSITGPHGAFPVFVFTPEGKGPFPVMVYYPRRRFRDCRHQGVRSLAARAGENGQRRHRLARLPPRA